MARRNDHSKEEIRQLVINSARQIITESGISGLTTRKLSQAIGYTVGTLYNIFSDYDDIILHINAVTLDEMQDFLASGLDKNLAGGDSLKKLAQLYINFAEQNYNKFEALFEYTSTKVVLPTWYQQKIDNLFKLVARVVADSCKEEESLKHAQVIWAGIHGICSLHLRQKFDLVTSESVESLANCLIENYLRGIKYA